MITIIGAGLSGLATAYRLQQAGIPYTILEANPVAGGRVQPAVPPEGSMQAGQQDLGPSWVWPFAQPEVEVWLDELGIKTYPQYDSGDGLIDQAFGEKAVRHFLPGQQGIERIHGGTHAIVKSLLSKLPDIKYNSEVTGCEIATDRIAINVQVNGVAATLTTDALVMAMPPRLVAPLLPADEALESVAGLLKQTSTWMAPHAKVVMFYEHAFWREGGLSGRVASQVGPLAEIHDHSGPDGTPAALFGFVGVPVSSRAGAEDSLIEAINHQLTRCFGEDAPKPTGIIIKDWAFEKYVSTEEDIKGAGAHPSVMNEMVRKPWCNNRLWFAAAETSAVSPGLIEGALARGDQVAKQVIELYSSEK